MTATTEPCGYAVSAVPYRLSIGAVVDPHPAADFGAALDALLRGAAAQLRQTGLRPSGRARVRVATGAGLPPGVWSALVLQLPTTCGRDH